MELADRAFPDILSEFATIGSSLATMIEQEKIDLKIVTQLDALVSFFEEKEKYWKGNKSISPMSAFALYHAWSNLRLIASKMRDRFQMAEKRHENPKTAVDGLRLLPTMLDVFTHLSEVGDRDLTKDEDTATYDGTTELRNIAYHSGMLPSMNEELREVDKKAVIEEFERFATGIQCSQTPRESDSGH
jgi:hypothetical protein